VTSTSTSMMTSVFAHFTRFAASASASRHALLSRVHALVVSKMDYCNSFPSGISGNLIDRLQSILNADICLLFFGKEIRLAQ